MLGDCFTLTSWLFSPVGQLHQLTSKTASFGSSTVQHPSGTVCELISVVHKPTSVNQLTISASNIRSETIPQQAKRPRQRSWSSPCPLGVNQTQASSTDIEVRSPRCQHGKIFQEVILLHVFDLSQNLIGCSSEFLPYMVMLQSFGLCCFSIQTT